MTLAHTTKLGFIIQETNVSAQKINGSTLVTYEIVIAGFLVQNKRGKVWFFKKMFLLADTSMKVVLGMRFLTFSNIEIWFTEKELKWQKYSIAEALPITQRFELINN